MRISPANMSMSPIHFFLFNLTSRYFCEGGWNHQSDGCEAWFIEYGKHTNKPPGYFLYTLFWWTRRWFMLRVYHFSFLWKQLSFMFPKTCSALLDPDIVFFSPPDLNCVPLPLFVPEDLCKLWWYFQRHRPSFQSRLATNWVTPLICLSMSQSLNTDEDCTFPSSLFRYE